MDQVKIAVIGLGPSGLTALKNLREVGFDAVGLDRRSRVGGLWSISPDPHHTSALHDTLSNVSKYVSSFSDFPIPQEYPPFLTREQTASYFESYVAQFGLLQHIQFGITVNRVTRGKPGDKWIVEATSAKGDVSLAFDKVVFATGCETIPNWPQMPNRNAFEGTILHAQQYRGSKTLVGKRVLVVGIGNTACDVSLSLRGNASKVYQAYRRGRVMVSRYEDNGVPSDCTISWQFMQLKYLLDHIAPSLAGPAIDGFFLKKMISDAARDEPPHLPKKERLRRAEENIKNVWRLDSGPSMAYSLPAGQEHFTSSLLNGSIIPLQGFKAFGAGSQVILADDTSVDVDAVIFCTGYSLDFSILPELEMDGAAGLTLKTSQVVAEAGNTEGKNVKPHLPRLFQMIFPPKLASSIAFLSWMELQGSAWSTGDLAAMAVAQVWASEAAKAQGGPPPPSGYRSPAMLPSLGEMESHVNGHHEWWRKGWAVEPSIRHCFLQSHTFYRFLHDMAGTGMYEHIDHIFSSRGWHLWWHDRELHQWLARGPMTSHAWRLFETNPLNIPGCGRQAWPDARKFVRECNISYTSKA